MARLYRERLDFNAVNNNSLIERYRVNHRSLDYICQQLGDALRPATARSHALSAEYKIMCTLRYLATGTIQLNDGDLHNVSQSSISRAITQTVSALSHDDIVSQHIRFPEPNELAAIKEGFYQESRFPNVIGVIDGTHVQIQAPTGDEEPFYVNRMGYHSINTQICFNNEDVITDIVARWPGATHDARILRESGLRILMEDNHFPAGDNYLLGDSGYPCRKWLLTPYLNPVNPAQDAYNRAHKRTRCKVERGIGQLKRRWGILHGEVRLSPLKTCQVITACAVLHNICKMHQVPALDLPENIEGNDPAELPEVNGLEGLRYRDDICQRHFFQAIAN